MAYVTSLEDWAAGVIRWHLDTPRYKHVVISPVPQASEILGRPTGLGTSSARVASRA